MFNLGMWLALIDVSACEVHSTAGQWAALTWQVFNGLTNPAVVLPILFGLILLPWFVRPMPWKRQISGVGAMALLIYALVCSPISIYLGNRLLSSTLPDDSHQSADAIVVLGRGPELRRDRVKAATDLWRAERAPLIFVSGWGDAQPLAQLLFQQGLPPEAVEGEPCSRTTEENAAFTAALLQPQGVHQILLVTDLPHMLRSLLTFRSFGFEVTPRPTLLPSRFSTRKEAFLIVREYMGLLSYGMLGRFSPRPVPSFEFGVQKAAIERLNQPIPD